ncbi:hypothetical protein AAZX31_19G228400 [Glycine max]
MAGFLGGGIQKCQGNRGKLFGYSCVWIAHGTVPVCRKHHLPCSFLERRSIHAHILLLIQNFLASLHSH